MLRNVASFISLSLWEQWTTRQAVKQVLRARRRGWERAKGEEFGRARVTEREGERTWEPLLLNAYHHVPGIRVGVRGNRMNSVQRHENLTRMDWFDTRALLFGVFSHLLFYIRRYKEKGKGTYAFIYSREEIKRECKKKKNRT